MERVLAILLVALGTYLTRMIPLKVKVRRTEEVESFLSYSSSALLSALFVTSLVSFPIGFPELGVKVASLVPVALVYLRWRNLGLSVLAGVAVNLALNTLL